MDNSFSKRLLRLDMRIYFHSIEIRKVFLINKFQLLLNIHLAVKEKVAVCWGIILSVKFLELFVGQFWDMYRITAGFIAVNSIRENSRKNFIIQLVSRVRKCTLHFIEYNTAVLQWLFRLFNLVMPALLQENFRLIIDRWVENRIKINIHKIMKILVIKACYWIHSLIWISHSIEEGI